jgi:hypothetical protein
MALGRPATALRSSATTIVALLLALALALLGALLLMEERLGLQLAYQAFHLARRALSSDGREPATFP